MELHYKSCVLPVLLIVLCSSLSATAQTPKTYPKAQGGVINLPAGDISFADRVVRFDEGNPSSSRRLSRNPDNILGPTDRPDTDVLRLLESTTLTLGCLGSITLEFTDNALIDIEGPDLHIWEAGDDIEPTYVEISQDGLDWLAIGQVQGATASLDIAGRVAPSASFRFVRVTDLKCLSRDGKWPGADIDAVAAVGSAERFVFDAGVFFDFDEASLSGKALSLLSDFSDHLEGRKFSSLVIEGHTDAKGSGDYNIELSRRRAIAVLDFLSMQPKLGHREISIRAVGEQEPVATNDTDEGRQRNRRVEIIVLP